MGAEKLYAVPLAQGKWVAKVCWGSCGKGCIGGLDLGEYGEAIPCVTVAAECPVFDGEMQYGDMDDPFTGEKRDVYLRLLRRPERADVR